jgi:plasmid maintenance system killer protein
MRIEFANQRLALIRTARAHELGLPVGVIRSYQEKLHFIEGAPDERDLRNWKSLEFKKLEGSNERQIKINNQYRMHFRLDTTCSPPLVTVTFIGDPH